MKTARPVYGPTNPDPATDEVQRFGSVIGLKPAMEQRYRELHANVWESVTTRLAESNVRNYSIFAAQLEGKKYLFSYFEYTGSDLATDMQAIADDPEVNRWWSETDPCQSRLPCRAPGPSWSNMERLFYMS